MNDLKAVVKKVPVIRNMIRTLRRRYSTITFTGSQAYWEQNYSQGGTSGAGSYGQYADFKAEVLNRFVQEQKIQSVIEFGCGDGNQLSLANYPVYIGLDVSKTAVKMCVDRFKGDTSKSFFVYDSTLFVDNARLFHADLAISLEVIFHLIEDDVFEQYMHYLFAAADRFVITYSSNTDESPVLDGPTFKNRRFSTWVDTYMPTWKLLETIPNRYPYDPGTGSGALSEFYIYGAPDQSTD